MKIAYFTPVQSPFIVELASQIQKEMPQGTILDLITMRELDASRSHWGKKQMPNINIKRYPDNVIVYLNEFNPNIIIYTGYRGKGLNNIKKWAKRHSCKFFIYACEKLLEYKKNDLFVLLKYNLYKHKTKGVNGVMACGNRAMSLYQKYTDVPVINVPYTFDMSRLLNFEMLPYDGSELVFLISGRLEPFRNPIYSIRLFYDIRKKYKNIKTKLIISGKGSLYDDILRLISQLEIEDDVEWINDFNKWEDIHEIYKKAHILLCLQDYGGWGVIVQEAMAAGLFVVGSSGLDAVDQMVIDGISGMYCNLKERNSIIENLSSYIENPKLFNNIRNEARNVAKCTDVYFYASRLATFLKNY